MKSEQDRFLREYGELFIRVANALKEGICENTDRIKEERYREFRANARKVGASDN